MKSYSLAVTSLFQLVKDYTRFFQTEEIPDYEFLKLSTTHRKFDALMRRFWDAFHPLTKDILTSFVFEVSALLETVEEMKKEVSIKEREVQKITKELNERREYIANLLEKLENEVKTQLSLTEEEIQVLEAESRAKSEMVEKLQQEVMMLKSELNSQSTLSSDAVTEAVLLDQKLNAYEREIEEQKEVIEKLTFDNLQLMDQNINLQKNSESLFSRIEDLELKLGKANSSIQSLEEQLKREHQENEKLRQMILDLKADKVSQTMPKEESDSFEQMMGKSELLDLKKDMMALTKVVKEEMGGIDETGPSTNSIEELKRHLLSVFDVIQSKDPTVDLFNLKEEIKEVAEKDPYGLLPIIENLLSTIIGNLMETKLEEIKREFLIEKIQLQSEIVQLRNRVIELTGSMDEPLKMKKELETMFEKENEAPKLDVEPEPQEESPDQDDEKSISQMIANYGPEVEEEGSTISISEDRQTDGQPISLADELKNQLDMDSDEPEIEEQNKPDEISEGNEKNSVGNLLDRFEKKLSSSKEWLEED